MKTKTVRHYIDKQPEVGDKIVVVAPNTFNADYLVGHELSITNAQTFTGNTVFAYSNRTGQVVCIHDEYYEIYRDVKYILEGIDVVEKKFMGITFSRKEIERWRAVQ